MNDENTNDVNNLVSIILPLMFVDEYDLITIDPVLKLEIIPVKFNVLAFNCCAVNALIPDIELNVLVINALLALAVPGTTAVVLSCAAVADTKVPPRRNPVLPPSWLAIFNTFTEFIFGIFHEVSTTSALDASADPTLTFNLLSCVADAVTRIPARDNPALPV